MKYSALIGNPVEHSISDHSFKLLTDLLNINYGHLKINVSKKEDLKSVCDSLINLKFVGFNVTCPYKLYMYNLIDEDKISLEARYMNSINSVVIKNEKMYGYNTDGKAAISSISHFYRIKETDKIVLLGAGGTAHSILYELYKLNKNIVIFNENINNAVLMVNKLKLDCKCYDLKDKDNFCRIISDSDIIINATIVGMYPNNDSLISENLLNSDKKKVLFDAVFNPFYTKMLQLANKYNHTTISGMYMLVYQAIYVLELWLDININLTKEQIDELVIKLKDYEEKKYV